MTPCSKEADISKIMEKVSRMEKIIEGNGHPGLLEIVTKLTVSVDNFSDNSEKMGTVLSGLLKFQNEYNGSGITREKYIKRNQYMVTTIIALTGVIISLLVIFIK